MRYAWPDASRSMRTRHSFHWLRRTPAATGILVSVAAIVMTPLTAAASIDAGSITVSASATLTLGCTGCAATLSGNSSGEIAGEDAGNNNVSYDVAWTGINNLAGALTSTTLCGGNAVPLSGSFTAPSSYTVTGAELVYDRVPHFNALITAQISGNWTADVAIIQTGTITIQWPATSPSI